MDSSVSDEGKLFVGGIAWDTKEDSLRDYFNKYGEVTHAAIMRDKATGHPRGFGFVVFSDPSVLDSILRVSHVIHGRMVHVKRALSRAQQQSLRSGDSNGISNSCENVRTKKIFVGGLPTTLTEGEFVQYFENYGDIADAVIMFDQSTGRSRGFGFVTFDTEDAVDRVLNKTFHELNNKLVEVKRALPKDVNPGHATRSRNFNSYGYHSSSLNALVSQMDSSRFLQPLPAGGGYSPYSGFIAPSFGYGLANTGSFYGGLGAYAVGSSIAGYSGSALAYAYGNQTATSTKFASSNADLLKSHWGNQTMGHAALGYGPNAGYGIHVPWKTLGGAVSLGPSPRGTANSGNSSYRGVESSYTDSGRHQTVNRHRRSVEISVKAGQNSAETEHHEAGGGFNGRAYDRSGGTS